MPRQRQYERMLGSGRAWIRVEIHTEGSIVTRYIVQLEVWDLDRWKPVRRYDNAHGRPHLDVLDRQGRQIDKQWLPYPTNDALTHAIADIRANWEQYLNEFMER